MPVDRVMALVVRPLCILFGVTGLGHLLATSAPVRSGTVDSYPRWLFDLFPLDERLSIAVLVSTELAITALAVASALGVALWFAGRTRRLHRTVAAIQVPIMALAGPSLLVVLAWMSLRIGWSAPLNSPRLDENIAGAVGALLLPAVAIGLPLAPVVTAALAGTQPYQPSFTAPAAGSLLASRSGSGRRWRVGFPAGMLACGLLTAELLMDRPGVFSLLVRSGLSLDLASALDALAVVAIGGALIGIVVDIFDPRIDRPDVPTVAMLRMTGLDERPSLIPLSVAGLGGAATVGLCLLGLALNPQQTDGTAPLARPLTDGHLFGTDELGRDVLAQILDGLSRALQFALIPSTGAAIAGLGLAVVWRRWPRVGHILPGTVVDAAWWPLPILLLMAALSFDTEQGLLDPAFLILTAIGLVPHALRILRREEIPMGAGDLLQVAGTWLLLAGYGFVVYLSASFSGVDDVTEPTLGAILVANNANVGQSAWPALGVALVSWLAMFSLLGLGSVLVRLGCYWTATVSTASLPAEDGTASFRITEPDRIASYLPPSAQERDPFTANGPLQRTPQATGPNGDTQPVQPPWR